MNSFDPIEHKYTVSGVEIPSVTQLLPPIDFFCTPEQLEAARLDGIKMHSAMEFYYDCDCQSTFEDPDVIGFDKLFQESKIHIGTPVLHEVPLYSKKYRFAGKPDVLYTKAIIDFKRSAQEKLRGALQMAGYMILAVENKIIKSNKRWYACYRSGKGHKMVNIYNDQAERIFLSLLRKWHIDQEVKNYFNK